MEPIGVGYALGAAALFGASTPAAKLLLRSLSPLMLSALLYLGAALALSAFRLVQSPRSREAPIARRDLPLLGAITSFGGVLGPILMLFGLRHLSAVSASLLLNLEAPFTALIAVGLMGEHLSRREILASSAIVLGAMLVSLQPGELGGSWIGVVEIAAACLCWGIDNNLTQRISLRDPVAVARFKALAAGSCVLALATARGDATIPAFAGLLGAGAVGAVCYGVSIVLDVKALRMLGAARESAYFATAPFAGALLSIAVLGELPNAAEVAGGVLMIIGVRLLLREQHRHSHAHDAIRHEHLHSSDEHHQHAHHGPVAVEPHSHPHEHPPMTHDHPHVSDLHHRHRH